MALDTQKFIDQLIENGYTQLCVVPCSFAKDLINGVINHPLIEYIPCASEAVACSVAAGLKIAGEKTYGYRAIFRRYEYGKLYYQFT